jgi:hypothetical protein
MTASALDGSRSGAPSGSAAVPPAGECLWLWLWEQALTFGPVERALSLAAAAGADSDVLRTMPYGRTNAGVLALRESLIGADLAATACCPACGSRVEFTVSAADLHVHTPVVESMSVSAGEYVVDWRPPTPGDLLDAASSVEPAMALRRHCLTARSMTGTRVDPATLPADVVELADTAMANADPLADIQVALTCPDCDVAFEADLDLGAFVWAEVEARAKRIIHEVDVLARTYGWTEAEVLALSETRRAAYLRMALDGRP